MKINLTTLGCPKNIVDSEILLGGLKGDGVEIVDDAAEAETLILNTCGFIQGAKEESIDAILQAVEMKKRGQCRRVFVTGCLSQRYREELQAEIPEVDGFYGNRDLIEILRDILSRLDLKRELLGERHLTTPRHFAYLKISEGCENPCTFCSIPQIRGKFQSRSLESLLEEAHRLADHGVQELILIAQDTTIYGQDLYGKKRIVPLLDKLTQIPAFKWLRLLYTYPAHFSDDLIEIISERGSIINYVDMPIQHISDRMLKLMGRRVRRAQIERIIEKLRTGNPELAIRSTLISGFPGETEQEHFELLDFVKQVRFHRLGMFGFSREENTPAYWLPEQIPGRVIQERLAELTDAQNEISFAMNHSLRGQVREVIFDESNPVAGESIGRTSWDCPEIDNLVLVKGEVEPSRFHRVRIVDCDDYDLIGELAE
jgi:ribosomal protein S12 methylthiotransferase